MERFGQVVVVLVAFLAVLGIYASIAIIGSDGLDTLGDAIKVLVGALAGVVIARRAE